MKIFFDHVNGFGKIRDYEVIINCAYGILEESETETEALENGWIPWKGKWYNERSTRIKLDFFRPTKTTKRLSNKIKILKGSFIDKMKELLLLRESKNLELELELESESGTVNLESVNYLDTINLDTINLEILLTLFSENIFYITHKCICQQITTGHIDTDLLEILNQNTTFI